MSILIKGMEMPESCDMCAFSSYIAEGDDHEEFWYCILDNWNQSITPIPLTKETVSNGRSMDCPLVEIPPHGRLIDADALDDILMNLADNEYTPKVFASWLSYEENAPTIIEAEGRE